MVHEAYIKLFGDQNLCWQNRAHFLGIATQSVGQILVDQARKRKSLKRGEENSKILTDEVFELSEKSDDQLIALDEALKKLETIEERSYKIVELRYFTGLTIE